MKITVAVLLTSLTSVRALQHPEAPAQHCRHDAGPPWGDDEENFGIKAYFANTPATPLGDCPAPLAAEDAGDEEEGDEQEGDEDAGDEDERDEEEDEDSGDEDAGDEEEENYEDECEDDPRWRKHPRKRRGKRYDCDWVAAKARKRCKKKNKIGVRASEACECACA